jgi:hypothetical protein
MYRHTSLTLEDMHSRVEADSRQLPDIKHVIAARSARNSGCYRLDHD